MCIAIELAVNMLERISPAFFLEMSHVIADVDSSCLFRWAMGDSEEVVLFIRECLNMDTVLQVGDYDFLYAVGCHAPMHMLCFLLK